jgi:hypothetical protein
MDQEYHPGQRMVSSSASTAQSSRQAGADDGKYLILPLFEVIFRLLTQPIIPRSSPTGRSIGRTPITASPMPFQAPH